jgi:hypothetical protein
MINDSGSTDAPRARFRMETGLEVLENWAEDACQDAKEAVYRALFAVADRSVFYTHRVVNDYQRANEFCVVLREELVLKVRVHDVDSFGIVYIGHSANAPRLNLGSAA